MGAIRSRNWPLAPRDRAWDADAAGDRVRRWAGGPAKENIDWDKFRSCHLWYDEDDPQNFGSYKLLYVDVIDGEPHVVFRALAAIIAVLNGARGGVDIPAADREKVYAEAAKQYRRFDEEPPELKRGLGLEIERRTVPFVEVRLEVPDGGGQPVIRGYAAVFDSPSEHLGSFREIIRRGAFARSIKEGDVRALWNHDSNYVLGRTKNGTLKLKEDIHGLAVEILPPDTQFARDFVESIRRGDVDQMSFGFRAVRDNWYTSDGETLRELVDVELYDVSPTAFPAYPQTSVTVRTVLAGAGIDWDALASVLIRAQRRLPLTSADCELLQASIDALRGYLPAGGRQGSGAGRGEGSPQARLLDLRRRVEEAERAI